MRQYAADRVKVGWTFSGDLTPGLAAGTFVQEERNAPTWNTKPDGFGGLIRMFNKDRSGQVTLLIDQESREHQVLRTLANTDRLTRALVGPLVVTDLNMKELAFYNQAFILTDPNLLKAVGPSTVAWVFAFSSIAYQAFGANNNVVGA